MKIYPRVPVAVAFFATFLAVVRAQQPPTPSPSATPAIQTGGEVAAQAAMEVWLGLVDDGRFPDSWKSAAGVFQKAVTQEQWITLMNAHRTPLGKVLSRARTESQFTKTLPGAPDGQYVVIHYSIAFEHKAVSVETVAAVLDADGQWKVCGYYIR